MGRNLFWLSDEQWARIEPHLPKDACDFFSGIVKL
jgi:transposase